MKVQILMSTYNGGQYIRTQLDSIIAQNIENKSLLIRDDGSTDDTVSIIHEYQKIYSWIVLQEGKNIGVQKSFFELISLSDESADFVAFADQDDQWLPLKLCTAVDCLKTFSEKEPALYCSDKLIVGKNLEDIDVTVSRVVRKAAFGNALVQNICTGCTAVINKSLLLLLKQNMPVNPEAVIMHDWWIYLVASCFGKVYYDSNAYIKYRQHGNNTAGAMLNRNALWKYRLSQLLKPRGCIYRQIEAFKETFFVVLNERLMQNEMDAIEKILRTEGSIDNRMRLVLDFTFFRQKFEDDLAFRLIVLVGKL